MQARPEIVGQTKTVPGKGARQLKVTGGAGQFRATHNAISEPASYLASLGGPFQLQPPVHFSVRAHKGIVSPLGFLRTHVIGQAVVREAVYYRHRAVHIDAITEEG